MSIFQRSLVFPVYFFYSIHHFKKTTMPKQKKTKFATQAAMKGGSISPYPSDRQKL